MSQLLSQKQLDHLQKDPLIRQLKKLREYRNYDFVKSSQESQNLIPNISQRSQQQIVNFQIQKDQTSIQYKNDDGNESLPEYNYINYQPKRFVKHRFSESFDERAKKNFMIEYQQKNSHDYLLVKKLSQNLKQFNLLKQVQQEYQLPQLNQKFIERKCQQNERYNNKHSGDKSKSNNIKNINGDCFLTKNIRKLIDQKSGIEIGKSVDLSIEDYRTQNNKDFLMNGIQASLSIQLQIQPENSQSKLIQRNPSFKSKVTLKKANKALDSQDYFKKLVKNPSSFYQNGLMDIQFDKL